MFWQSNLLWFNSQFLKLLSCNQKLVMDVHFLINLAFAAGRRMLSYSNNGVALISVPFLKPSDWRFRYNPPRCFPDRTYLSISAI